MWGGRKGMTLANSFLQHSCVNQQAIVIHPSIVMVKLNSSTGDLHNKVMCFLLEMCLLV